MIEHIFPGNKSKIAVVKAIYENPGIHLTALIKKISVSPNLVLSYVNELCFYGVINEERIKGKKKALLRRFTSSFDNDLSLAINSLVELDKRFVFFKRYPSLKTYFTQFPAWDICVLVYGSYAQSRADRDSDLDVMIIGRLTSQQEKRIREIFITLPTEVSLKMETVKRFLRNKDKPLYQNILKTSIVVLGTGKFMELNRHLYK
ncbi:MAG TPA: nucleotidyltransferase domain-containing protein [Candidatus Nanoarchaeia archaeon]|nr:nucleotidyltransferase domain-containing protein [Candidatus Nanoarchaeia archaeon]